MRKVSGGQPSSWAKRQMREEGVRFRAIKGMQFAKQTGLEEGKVLSGLRSCLLLSFGSIRPSKLLSRLSHLTYLDNLSFFTSTDQILWRPLAQLSISEK